MKKLLTIPLFLLISLLCKAQDCTIEKYILKNNHYDAEMMAWHEVEADSGKHYKDSIMMPKALVNKYLLILSSAYRQDPTPFDDKTHMSSFDNMYTVYIEVDKTVPWIHKFAAGKATRTGNAAFDNLLIKYKLVKKPIETFQTGNKVKAGTYWLRLESDYYINVPALEAQFDKIRGVRKAAYDEIPTMYMRSMHFDIPTQELSLFVDKGGNVFNTENYYFKVISPCVVEKIEKTK